MCNHLSSPLSSSSPSSSRWAKKASLLLVFIKIPPMCIATADCRWLLAGLALYQALPSCVGVWKNCAKKNNTTREMPFPSSSSSKSFFMKEASFEEIQFLHVEKYYQLLLFLLPSFETESDLMFPGGWVQLYHAYRTAPEQCSALAE